MTISIKAFAATTAKKPLTPFEYQLGELTTGQVDIAVENCGICHSDLSMINNDWQMTAYPLVPGHEVVGKVCQVGPGVTKLKLGDRVGVGWYTKSCLQCQICLQGDQNLCGTAEQTIVRRHGGFATHIRTDENWAIPLPLGVSPQTAGPLFCGGITVFNPIIQCNVKPTDRVGVIGIGGLGHLALQFLSNWGCEVTAFSSSRSKDEELKKLGADQIVDSRDPKALQKLSGSLDFILSTVNVPLDWNSYISCLRPRGRMHFVGAVLEPIPVSAFSLIGGQKSISGSPLGSPATVQQMLEFCARHKIEPMVEFFPLSKVNDALKHLESGKARYRLVLTNDLG